MSVENTERLKKAINIISMRTSARGIDSFLGGRSAAWNRDQKPYKWAIAAATIIGVNFLPVAILAKIAIALGVFTLLTIINMALFMIIHHSFFWSEKQYERQFHKQLMGYLEKYYQVDTAGLKYGLLTLNVYGTTDKKLKLVRTYDYDLPVVPLDTEIVKTPDINGILYYGSMTVKGEYIKDVLIQLTPDRNIVLLHEGKEIESVPAS